MFTNIQKITVCALKNRWVDTLFAYNPIYPRYDFKRSSAMARIAFARLSIDRLWFVVSFTCFEPITENLREAWWFRTPQPTTNFLVSKLHTFTQSCSGCDENIARLLHFLSDSTFLDAISYEWVGEPVQICLAASYPNWHFWKHFEYSCFTTALTS